MDERVVDAGSTAAEAAPARVECAGVPITPCTRQQAALLVLDLARSPEPGPVDVHLCNAYTLALADRDPLLGDVLRRARLNLPDGQSVVWANRLLHRDADLPRERVYGPDLFADVVGLGQPAGLRHYLLGSTPSVLDRLESRLRHRYPAVIIAGRDSPPFRALTDAEWGDRTRRIRESGAQVTWLGLGTPKQDFEAGRLSRELPGVVVAVGAAFDFLAGTKPQAPPWMRRNGLEWLFRLGCEPRRLWRRYLFGNARFVYAAVRGRRSGSRCGA